MTSALVHACLPVLLEHCRWRAKHAGDTLEKRFSMTRNALGKRLEFVHFMSPVTFLFRQFPAQLLLLILGALSFANAHFLIHEFLYVGPVTAQLFRVSMTQTVEPFQITNQSARIEATFALFNEGCNVLSRNATLPIAAGTFELYLLAAAPSEVDNFALVVQNFDVVSAWRPAILLQLWISNTAAEYGPANWSLVGTSNQRMVAGGLFSTDNTRRYPVPRPLHSQQSFDLRPPWPVAFDAVFSSLLLGFGCVAAAVLGAAGRPAWGKAALLAACALLALGELVVAVGYFSSHADDDAWRRAFSPLTYAGVFAAVCAVLAREEAGLFRWMAALSIVAAAVRAVEDCLLFDDCPHFVQSPPYYNLGFLLGGLGLAATHRRFLTRCAREVEGDAACYEAAWAAVLADPAQRTMLESSALTAAAALARPGRGGVASGGAVASLRDEARQMLRPPGGGVKSFSHSGVFSRVWSGASSVSGASVASAVGAAAAAAAAVATGRRSSLDEGKHATGVPLAMLPRGKDPWEIVGGGLGWVEDVEGDAGGLRPVVNMDQLYSQALGLAPFLQRLCDGWAANSGGVASVPRCRTPSPKRRRGTNSHRPPPIATTSSPSSRTARASSASNGGSPIGRLRWAARGPWGRVSGGGGGTTGSGIGGISPDIGDTGVWGSRWNAASGSRESSMGGTGSAGNHRALVRGLELGWIKKPARAADKALACRGGDPSRLLDLCRGRLVFASAADLARCLERVAADTTTGGDGVRIVRVKNGLDPAFDARETAGFRAVIINLRIDNEDTRALGVHRHIAEVQLVLQAFVDVQASLPTGWHERYLRFRAVRTHASRRDQFTVAETSSVTLVASFPNSHLSPQGPSASPPPLQLHPPPQPIPPTSDGHPPPNWPFASNRRRILPEGPGSPTAEEANLNSAAEAPTAATGPHDAGDGGVGGDMERLIVHSRQCCGDGVLQSWGSTANNRDSTLDSETCGGLCSVLVGRNDVVKEMHAVAEGDSSSLPPNLDESIVSKYGNDSARNSQGRYSIPKIGAAEVRGAALLDTSANAPEDGSYVVAAKEAKSPKCDDDDDVNDEDKETAPSGWFAPFEGSHATCEDPEQVIRAFLWTTSAAGGALDARRARVDAAMRLSSAGSAWFTSKPLQAAASKGLFQLFFIGLAGFLFYRGINLATSLAHTGSFHASRLRLEVLDIRSGARPTGHASLGGLGILSGGCIVSSGRFAALNDSGMEDAYKVGSERAVFEVDLQNSSGRTGTLDGDGYFFETSNASAEADPVRWALYAQVSDEDAGNWKLVGASGWLLWFGGENRFYPELSFDTPTSRNFQVKVDLRPSWPSILSSFTATFEWTICLILCVVAGRMGQARRVGPMIAFFAGLDVVAELAACIGSLVLGDPRRAAQFLLYAATPAVLAGGVLWCERSFLAVLVAFGVSHAIAAGLVHLWLYKTPWLVLLRELATSETSATLAFAILVLAMRRRIVRRALSLVRQDLENYNELWAAISGTDAARGQLQAMQKEVERLLPHGTLRGRSGAIFGRPRHLDRPMTRRGMSLTSSFASWAVNVARPSRPIRSLDQLYLQALMLHPILLRRVKVWARACGGLFPLLRRKANATSIEESPRITYARLTDSGFKDSDFKFARIKSVERAVEKIERTYGQDASLLVDICRQSIVFDSIPDMTACLRSIACDSQVVLHRVKNRLRLDYDATSSAGYRDVALNLSLTNSDTRGLGLDGHVCEVQLLLRAFAELKSDDGHKRYVTFRQLRGE